MENNPKVGAPARDRLLIKVILPKQGAERRVPVGRGKAKPFRRVDEAFRGSLVTRLHAVGTGFKTASVNGFAPFRVKLIKEGSAKSHRPAFLFSDKTCPIFGAGRLGELFIKGSAAGLKSIEDYVRTSKNDRVVKEISTIETIEPITPEFRRAGRTPAEVLSHSPKLKGAYLVKVKLFDFGDEDQAALHKDFLEKCTAAGIAVSNAGYAPQHYFYAAACATPKQVELLSNLVSVKTIRPMPTLQTIRTQGGTPLPLPADIPQPKERLGGYPVVAVVDSGISTRIPALQEWVVGRRSTIPADYHNTAHGTFVAGLLCWGKELNPDLDTVDGEGCKVFDVHVLPNDDPDAGPTDDLTESQLLQDLETALKAHANDIKVWNISMGTNEVCSLDEFSTFAMALDELQEKYNVSFVISAGNYTTMPLLDYPRQGAELTQGRITTPADSLLGITVGSVAHRSHKNNGPQNGEPSAFSRHGAGPNYIIKPDLVHYGGTCTRDGVEQLGVQSVGDDGVVQNMGTSFSAPLVSRALANLYHQITPTPSPVLARGILTHHARHPVTGGRVKDREENFIGFGVPGPLSTSLECPPWASTLVFEDALRPGYFLEWDNFPYPDSLIRGGRYFGNIWMTVAFAPSRGSQWGTEYCESHIDAGFGVYRTQPAKGDKPAKSAFKGLVPPEHKDPGQLYEAYQIQTLRKWAPVRTYFGSMGKRGQAGERWCLRVRLLSRHTANQRSQKFSLLVTIADPEKKAPVYNEMAVKIRNKWQVENLSLRSMIQVQQ